MKSAKVQVKEIVGKTLSFNAVDEAISVNQPTDIVTNQSNLCLNELTQFFNSFTNATNPTNENQDNPELQLKKEGIHELVNQLFQQQHTKKQLIILRLITKLVNQRVIDVRYACEYMLNNLVYECASNNLKQLNNKLSTTNNSNNSNLLFNSYNFNLVQKLNQTNPTNQTNLKTTSTFLWCKIMECVQKFIPLHDYKSCRDIFKMLLEVVKRLPHSSSSYPPQLEVDAIMKKSKYKRLIDYSENNFDYEFVDSNKSSSLATDDIKLESLFETISFLLDHKNYFMPRYLAINEIKTVLTFGKEPYHQRFHNIFTTFIESFIPIAHLISVSGRDKLLPVVGFSNLYSLYSFWRFNPSTCKFITSGPLPYFKHVSKPHHEVFFYLLRQNTPQYLLLGLMSLHRNQNKTRFFAFEEEFAKSIVDTMNLTEKNNFNHFENLRIWNNLVNHIVVLNQVINLPSLIHQLTFELKKASEPFVNSREWLMWFLLLIIPSHMNRNCLPEFSDLYETLFKDDEALQCPELNSFECVVKFASLSIWIHFNLKLTNQNPQEANVTSRARTPVVPEIIKNQYNVLQDCMNMQSFHEYGISICLNAYSSETSHFNKSFNILMEQIGKSVLNSQQLGENPISMDNTSVFTNHQPLSFDMIASFTLHVRIHLATYLTYFLSQKTPNFKALLFNIPASIVETFARLLIFDPDNFMKYLTQNVWQTLTTLPISSLPLPSSSQSLQQHQIVNIQTNFLYQQINLLIELICFRLKRLSFTHRTQFLVLLNSLFTLSNQSANFSNSGNANQQQQQQQQVNQQQQQINYVKHPQIYINIQTTMLKLLSSFSGSDYYELLNSIYSSSKHAPKNFINQDSEEINKAIVFVIARAIHLTSSDLQPLENKDKDDSLRSLFREIMKTTPIYFHEHVINCFPKVIQEFFIKEQQQTKTLEIVCADSSNKKYKSFVKQRVDDDYKRFLDCRHESQAQAIFQNNNPPHTLFSVFFNLLQDPNFQFQDPSVQQTLNNYLKYILNYLNNCENKKIIQSLRTFCDYLIIESTNKSLNELNETFRSFDSNDFQLALQLLNLIFIQNSDFDNNYKNFLQLWESHSSTEEEWNNSFYSQYIRLHPEKFFYEGIKNQLNIDPTNEMQINSYYGNMILRCVPILDFLNSRYIELNSQPTDAERMGRSDQLLDYLNNLFKFHYNPISFVYNSLIYYNGKFELFNTDLRKKRLLNILLANQKTTIPYFSTVLSDHMILNDNQFADITPFINTNYFYLLIQRFVKTLTLKLRMLDNDPAAEFNSFKSEYQNPSCHLLYITLCELICLELFAADSKFLSRSICSKLINMFFIGRFHDEQFAIDKNEYVYWTNAAGIIIANLPETYWYPIYDEFLAETMKTDELLNQTEIADTKKSIGLLDHFDLFIADEKNCFNKVTLIITIFHSIWCHSSANHFQYFLKFIKERRDELVKTELHFLFICKLIGPFLSKIHMENTNLLIELAQELYDMIHRVDSLNPNLYYMETICNFFYHLKYRHIGESIKEKIHSLMPDFRPELKTQFKYITSELNQMQQLQQQQQQQQQQIQQYLKQN